MANKTMGIFKVTSNFNTEESFKLVGASSQIEICTKDYMSWCKKGKAPKTMQAEYDRVMKIDHLIDEIDTNDGDPTKIFKVDILQACETADQLFDAKVKFGLNKTIALKPESNIKVEPATELASPAEPIAIEKETKTRINYRSLFDRYKNGESVSKICEEANISKSSFYNKIKDFK